MNKVDKKYSGINGRALWRAGCSLSLVLFHVHYWWTWLCGVWGRPRLPLASVCELCAQPPDRVLCTSLAMAQPESHLEAPCLLSPFWYWRAPPGVSIWESFTLLGLTRLDCFSSWRTCVAPVTAVCGLGSEMVWFIFWPEKHRIGHCRSLGWDGGFCLCT